MTVTNDDSKESLLILQNSEPRGDSRGQFACTNRRLAPNGTHFAIRVAGTLRVPSANSRVSKGYGTWKVPATLLNRVALG